MPVDGPVRLARLGVDGDTICDLDNHGGPDQAVYAYSSEDLAFWSAELGRPVATVGQNLTLSLAGRSGTIDDGDFTVWLNQFGQSNGSGGLGGTAGVPEPATWVMGILGLAAIAAASQARRRI